MWHTKYQTKQKKKQKEKKKITKVKYKNSKSFSTLSFFFFKQLLNKDKDESWILPSFFFVLFLVFLYN